MPEWGGAELVVIDRAASTAEIAGRRFPAVTVICPNHEDEDRTKRDRALGAGGGDQCVYIPAENGLLLRVEEARNEKYHAISLDLHARSCELVWSVDEWIYLPWNVAVIDGKLVAGTSNFWSWAEPEWVVETIDRLCRKPFMQPDGPLLEIVPLHYFDREACDV